ncbi:MAG: hypothetical protein CL949_10035 [Erythrobacter sp.]|nr:hypothetical protein [Erythrobacter sp.]
MLNHILGKVAAHQRKRKAATANGTPDGDGGVTDAEAAVLMSQAEAGSEGLTVTDNSVISKAPGSAQESEGESPDVGADGEEPDGSSLYANMGVDTDKAALKGLDVPASTPAKPTSGVKDLIPQKFGGSKAKKDLAKPVRKRLQMMAETYMMDVDEAADEEAAVLSFIRRFRNHLIGMTDEHFAYLGSLTTGNGEGVANVARQVMKNGSRIETSYEDAIDATSGIDNLDAKDLRRGDQGGNTAATKAEPGSSSESDGQISKELDADARLMNSRRFTSLLMRAAAEGAAVDLPDDEQEDETPLIPPSPAAGVAQDKEEGGDDAAPSAPFGEEAEMTTPEKPKVAANDFEDFSADILNRVKQKAGSGAANEGKADSGADGSSDAPGTTGADDNSGQPDPACDKAPNEGGLLGFGDETATSAANDEPQQAKDDGNVSENGKAPAGAITAELCGKFLVIVESKGSASELRSRLEDFERANGLKINQVLVSPALDEMFGAEKVNMLQSRVSSILRDSIDFSLDSQLAEYGRIDELVRNMENAPHNMNMAQLNSVGAKAGVLVTALNRLNDSDLEVQTARANAGQLLTRINELKHRIVNPGLRGKPAVDPEMRSVATSFLDNRKLENERAAGLTAAEGDAAVAERAETAAVSNAAPGSVEGAAPASPQATELASSEHALADLAGDCASFDDLVEIINASVRGEEWHHHPNLGDVFVDPFKEPQEEGGDTLAARKRMLALQSLRERAKPIVEAEHQKLAAAEERRLEAADLEKEREEFERERAGLDELRNSLNEQQAVLARSEKAIAAKEQELEKLPKHVWLKIETVREELGFFAKPDVPPRFADFGKDYARLLLLNDTSTRMKQASVLLDDYKPNGLPEGKSPSGLANMITDACILQRGREFLMKVCNFLEVDANPNETIPVETLLEKAKDEEERGFIASIHGLANRGRLGMNGIRAWMDECVKEVDLIAKGQSLASSDLANLKARADELEKERDRLTSELAVARADLEKQQALSAAAVANEGAVQVSDNSSLFDRREDVAAVEERFDVAGFPRVPGSNGIQVFQRRVFVGLTKEGWDRHPDKEETLEAMKSANNVILFTNIESDLNLPSDISIAVKSLDILSADDFISEVVNGESVNA